MAAKVRPENSYVNGHASVQVGKLYKGPPWGKELQENNDDWQKRLFSLREKPLIVCPVQSDQPWTCLYKKDKTGSVGYTFVHAYLCLYATIIIKGNRKSSVEDGAWQGLENKLDIIIFQSKPHIYQ